MKVQASTVLFVLSGLFASAILSEGIEVTEEILENGEENGSGNNNNNINEQNSETLASSTNKNATTYKNNWSSASQPKDVHRITNPVVITSPHADRNKNFTASPMLDAIYNPDYYQPNQEHYSNAAQKHNSHTYRHHHYLSTEDDDGHKKHQYSQPLPPDLFLAQQYLKVQQMKEQERSNKQSFPKPAVPEAKSNGYINTDNIPRKPLKFDTDIPSILFNSDKGGSSMTKGSGYDSKEVPFQFTLPTPMKGNTHPYPYQSLYSSGESEVEPPNTSSSPTVAKYHNGGSWMDGYKTGIAYHEGEKTSMWKKVLNVLAAFIPLGLFLAALPPNILTINNTQPDLPSRQRSVDHDDDGRTDVMSFPILDLLDKYGIDSLDDPECENRIFCEMSRLGGQPSGNVVQKAFWHLAHDTPDITANGMGMKELFKAVRTNACDIYRCKEKQEIEITTLTPMLKAEKEY